MKREIDKQIYESIEKENLINELKCVLYTHKTLKADVEDGFTLCKSINRKRFMNSNTNIVDFEFNGQKYHIVQAPSFSENGTLKYSFIILVNNKHLYNDIQIVKDIIKQLEKED